MKDRCLWCKGTGKLNLKSSGVVTCRNCKGSGKGKDGGCEGIISGHHQPWMIGNKFNRKVGGGNHSVLVR